MLTEKLRESIAVAVLGLTFATLGTIGTLSLTFLLTSGEQLDSDFRKAEYALKEYSDRSSRGNDFLKRSMDAEVQEIPRIDHFIKLFGGKDNGEALRTVSRSNIKELTEEYASLSGYTPESTGVGKKYHDNVSAFFRTELDFWRWVERNAGVISTGRHLPSGAEEELREWMLKRDFDIRALESSYQDAKFDRSLRLQDISMRTDELRTEVMNWKWRFRLSGAGVFLTASIFFFVFRYLVFANRDSNGEARIGCPSGRFE